MEEVFLRKVVYPDRIKIIQFLISFLLLGCLCSTFWQFDILDFSFSVYALTCSVIFVTCIVFAFSLVLKKSLMPKLGWVDALLFFYVIYNIIRYDFNEQLANWRIVLWGLFLVIWVLLRWLRVNRLLSSECVAWVIVLSCCLQAIWGELQLYGFCPSNHEQYVITGSFLNPGPFTGYVAISFPIALHLSINNGGYKRWLAFLSMLVTFSVLPVGMSRSSWVGVLIASGLVLFWQRNLKKYWYIRKRLFIIVISLFCILGFVSGIYLFNLKRDSVYGRLFIWENVYDAVVKHPIVGYGSCSFPLVYASSQSNKFESGNFSAQEEKVAGNPECAFNEYLQMWLEGGIIMPILFISIVVICMKQGLRQKQYGLCGGLISLLCFAFSSYPFQYPSFGIVLCFMLAGIVELKSSNGSYIISSLVLLILLFFSVTMLSFQSSPQKQIDMWEKCRILSLKGEKILAIKGYELLYPSLKHSSKFIFEYAQCLSDADEYSRSNELYDRYLHLQCNSFIYNFIGNNYFKMDQFQLAELYYNKSIHFLPNRIYPYYLLAKLYANSQFRNPNKFQEMAHIVLYKNPKVHSRAIEEMREEIRKIAQTNYLPI